MSTFSCDNISTMVTEEQLAAWKTLNTAHALVVARVDQALAEAGLPPRAWYETLAAIRDAEDGPLKMGEIAKAIGISPGGTTKLVDKLVDAGLVQRIACPTDRRASHVDLLPAGQKLLVKMWPVYSEALAAAFVDPLEGDTTPAASLARVTEGVSCPTDVLPQRGTPRP